METILAKSAGFCFGVKRAVDYVYDLVNRGEKNIYTFGPIIHNDDVVNDLASKGVTVINDENELEKITEGYVVIRAHGISKRLNDFISGRGLNIIDGTCPFVKRIHDIVYEKSNSGSNILIIGNPEHPEVLGIKGWSVSDTYVIETPEQAVGLKAPKDVPLCVVSQTTFNQNKFQELVEIIENKGYNVNVVNTICNATKERQIEAGLIASKVDAMIVIGGRHSSNTQKLFEICKKECDNTYFVEGINDLLTEIPKTASLVGLTAGASTPNNIIEEVQNYVRINF